MKYANKKNKKGKLKVISIDEYVNSFESTSDVKGRNSKGLFLKFPSTYCLYEWRTENKTLKIYNTFDLYEASSDGYYENYYLEIYNERTIDTILNKIITYKETIFKNTINSNKEAIKRASKKI